MYCTHCAKKIDETKLEAKVPSFGMVEEVGENTTVSYVCPRCGHLIHADISAEETKSLARAAHAQIQRARNNFASGMGLTSVGIIALAVSILFFFLAKKPSNNYRLVTDCAEFYVFLVLGVLSIILLATGISLVSIGLLKKKANLTLLQEINDQTFFQ